MNDITSVNVLKIISLYTLYGEPESLLSLYITFLKIWKVFLIIFTLLDYRIQWLLIIRFILIPKFFIFSKYILRKTFT